MLHSRNLTTALALVGIPLVIAACSSTTATSVPQPAVVASPSGASASAVLSTASTPLGTILVDSHGRTVYEFASDSKGTSTCTGQCLAYWPVVKAPASLPGSLAGITGTVGSLTRPDGGTQLTINGLPLYTYAGDTAPGMTNGQGSNGSGAEWWVVAPSGSPITTSGSTASASAAAAPATPSGY